MQCIDYAVAVKRLEVEVVERQLAVVKAKADMQLAISVYATAEQQLALAMDRLERTRDKVKA